MQKDTRRSALTPRLAVCVLLALAAQCARAQFGGVYQGTMSITVPGEPGTPVAAVLTVPEGTGSQSLSLTSSGTSVVTDMVVTIGDDGAFSGTANGEGEVLSVSGTFACVPDKPATRVCLTIPLVPATRHLEFSGERVSTYHWTASAGGDFSLSTNWDLQQVPLFDVNRSDTAIFDLTGNSSPIPILGRDNAVGRFVIQHMAIDLNGPVRVLQSSADFNGFTVGDGGVLVLDNGVTFLTTSGIVGAESGADSSVFISGAGTSWTTLEDSRIGDVAPGLVLVDHDAVFDATGHLAVGNAAAGTLRVESGGQAHAPNCTLNGGSIQVRGQNATSDSKLTIDDQLDIGGQSGTGTVTIESGGTISAHRVLLGDRAATGGETLTVSGVDTAGVASTLDVAGSDGELHVAGAAATQLEVKDGGLLKTSGPTRIGEQFAVGTILVHGASGVQSTWNAFASVTIGGQLTPSELIVQDAGSVTASTQLAFGFETGDEGSGTVSGTNSFLFADKLAVGADGHGRLLISDGAHVLSTTGFVGQSRQASAENPVASGGPGDGIVQIQGDAILGASEWHVRANCFVGTDERGAILLQGSAIGPFTVGGATLRVDGALRIGPQGEVNGIGTLAASRIVNHGFISPGFSPGVISIEGDYEQPEDGVLKIEVAGLGDGQFDVLKISGNATLAGRVDLQFIDGFVPKPGDKVDFVQVSGQITGKLTGGTIDVPADPNAGNSPMTVAVNWEVTSEGTCRMSVTDVRTEEQAAARSTPTYSGCGAGLCGAGVVPMLPLTLAGMGFMKQRIRHPRKDWH